MSGGSGTVAGAVCFNCKQPGHFSNQCTATKISGYVIPGYIAPSNPLKTQVDPAIHQLLMYSLGVPCMESLPDIEGLELRNQLRVVPKEVQKLMASVGQSKGSARGASSLSPQPTKGHGMLAAALHVEAEADIAGKRPAYDTSKPMTAAGVAAFNANKKQKIGGSAIDSFFGRKKDSSSSQAAKIARKDASSVEAAGTLFTKHSTITFKFNKGFSNAVKRPVSISDFL